MSAFFVALRESVRDPEEMKLYAEKAGASANGHHLIPRVAYGRLRMTEGEPFEGAAILEFPTFEEAEVLVPQPGVSGRRGAQISWREIPDLHRARRRLRQTLSTDLIRYLVLLIQPSISWR